MSNADDPSSDVSGTIFRHYNYLNHDPVGIAQDRTRRLANQILPWRNRIINGNFVINQTGYVSGAALASGAYGHDGWKAGSGGGDYTFTQGANSTTITIKANKTLIQVIEDKMVEGGAYWLTWTGAAQARVGIDSATPSGSYSAAPIRWVNTAGTTMSVEFNSGTLGEVNLQPGRIVTPFASRPYGQEYALCRRYYFRVSSNSGNDAYFAIFSATSTTTALGPIPAIAGMRTTPTIGYSAVGDLALYNGSFNAMTAFASGFPPEAPIGNATVASGLTTGQGCLAVVRAGTGKYVDFSARL